MEFIKCITKCSLLIVFLFFLEHVNAQENNIFGDWRYVKHYSWKVTKYSGKDVNAIKSSILHIDLNKVYFEGPASLLIEPCIYTKCVSKKFFDRAEKEPSFVEDRALAVWYTKKQLETITRIELNCEYNCLELLYQKQDTLILNYCGGITFFMVKSDSKTSQQFDLNNDAKVEYEKVDKDLNNVYQELIQDYKNDTVFIKSMKEAQRQWVKFRDAQVKMKYPSYPGADESILPMCKYYYLKEITISRIKVLMEWINGVEEGDVCSGSIKTKQ